NVVGRLARWLTTSCSQLDDGFRLPKPLAASSITTAAALQWGTTKPLATDGERAPTGHRAYRIWTAGCCVGGPGAGMFLGHGSPRGAPLPVAWAGPLAAACRALVASCFEVGSGRDVCCGLLW